MYGIRWHIYTEPIIMLSCCSIYSRIADQIGIANNTEQLRGLWLKSNVFELVKPHKYNRYFATWFLSRSIRYCCCICSQSNRRKQSNITYTNALSAVSTLSDRWIERDTHQPPVYVCASTIKSHCA